MSAQEVAGRKHPGKAGGAVRRHGCHTGMVEAALSKANDPHEAGMALSDAADRWPEQLTRLTTRMSKCAIGLSIVTQDANDHQKSITRYVLLYRQRVIRELEISSASEFMLLDAAMDAYMHYMHLSALVRSCFKDGSGGEMSRLQARIASMAQSYLKTYTESMKALTDMKLPPLRVLKVEAGHTVAVQVNEQPRKGSNGSGEGRHLRRRKNIKSAPAAPEAAEEDPD